MIIKSIFTTLIVSLPFVTNAAIVSYSGTFDSSMNSNVSFINVRQNETVTQISPNFTQSVTIEVDTTFSTLTYKKLDYHIDAFSLSFIDSNTTEFGETIDIVTTLNFNEINVGLTSGIGPLSLTPTSGGAYNVESYTCSEGCAGVMEDAVLSGVYSISGPSQTIAGDFSTALPLFSAGSNQAILDTSNYPLELGIDRGIFWPHFMPGESGNIFHGVVDGVDVNLTNEYLLMYDPAEIFLTPSAVPIPPAVWLFGSGLIGLIGVARRKVRV